MYELTELLIAIASIAASFVAILGGFIVSKLLAITTERESVEYDLESKIEDRERIILETEELQKLIDEEDATQFIIRHIDAFIEKKILKDVYDSSERNDISFERLLLYWNNSLQLLNELEDCLGDTNVVLNSDNIPSDLTQKYTTNSFSYGILVIIMEHYKRQNPFVSLRNVPLELTHTTGFWYSKAQNDIETNNNRLDECDFNISQLKRKKSSLIIPKGIISGLIIFALFTVASIIVPLCLCPYTTDNYTNYCIIKCVFIIVFSLGLLAIFCYLIYLLKWKKDRKKENK